MRTGQSAQMRLASREEPAFSGKKTSGSYSRHLARSCQGMKWCTAILSPQNHIRVILGDGVAIWQEVFFLRRFFPHRNAKSWRSTQAGSRVLWKKVAGQPS